MLDSVTQSRQAGPFPDPPGADAIGRWLAGASVRLGMRRHWRWWLIGSMLLVVALAVLREPLGAWLWPQTRAQALRDEAELALARGLLTAEDGRGARELFAAAIAMDPDRGEARQGLARVAMAALDQARKALAEDRFADAHRLLAMARALSVPRAEADALAQALRQREAGHAGIDGIFARAEEAHAQGRLDGSADSALPLYARVLALEPAHPAALRGREDALGELLAQAREALRAGDIDHAVRLVATARGYDPAHIDLTDTVARLMEESGLDGEGVARLLAGEAAGGTGADGVGGRADGVDPVALDPAERARRVDTLLAEAEAARLAGKIFAPRGESAVDKVAEARAGPRRGRRGDGRGPPAAGRAGMPRACPARQPPQQRRVLSRRALRAGRRAWPAGSRAPAAGRALACRGRRASWCGRDRQRAQRAGGGAHGRPGASGPGRLRAPRARRRGRAQGRVRAALSR